MRSVNFTPSADAAQAVVLGLFSRCPAFTSLTCGRGLEPMASGPEGIYPAGIKRFTDYLRLTVHAILTDP